MPAHQGPPMYDMNESWQNFMAPYKTWFLPMLLYLQIGCLWYTTITLQCNQRKWFVYIFIIIYPNILMQTVISGLGTTLDVEPTSLLFHPIRQ
jgi:hypothetical protein